MMARITDRINNNNIHVYRIKVDFLYGIFLLKYT
jgi:hypothetical protein